LYVEGERERKKKAMLQTCALLLEETVHLLIFPQIFAITFAIHNYQCLALFMPGTFLCMRKLAQSRLEQITTKVEFVSYISEWK
jgi:hypothetical protein